MPQLTFPLPSNELKLTLIVALNHQEMVNRLAAGRSIPAPIWGDGLIDTGSSITCVTNAVIQRLGLLPAGQTSTRTVSGSLPVKLFRASLSIPPAGNVPGTMLTRSDLLVMELIDPIPGIEVLIGLDILLDCRLLLDGPARRFTLDF